MRRGSGSETHGETRASLNRPVANVLKARIRLKFLDRSLKEASTQSYTTEPAAHTDTPSRSQYRLSPESRLLKSLPFRFCSDPFPPFRHIPKAERNVEGEFQRFQTFQ
jgi:hypothetical protein